MENTIIPAKVICFSNTCGTGYYYSIIEYTLIHLTHFLKKRAFIHMMCLWTNMY